MEVKIDDVTEDINEIKDDVKAVLKKFEDLDNRYPTPNQISFYAD